VNKSTAAALQVAYDFGQSSDPDTLAWVIDQMVRALLGRHYYDWVADYRTGGTDGLEINEWSEGRSPDPVQPALAVWGR
jgi:hypothetical protein